MISIMRNTLFKAVGSLFLLCGIVLSCTSVKNLKEETRNNVTDEESERSSTRKRNTTPTATEEYGLHVHDQIFINSDVNTPPELVSSDAGLQKIRMNGEREMAAFLSIKSAVADKIVENYLINKMKMPGGHCLTVSKTRFEKAYKEVHGHSLYQDLPYSMATKSFTPKQVFNMLYASASEPHQRWRSLPEKYRGKGNAGAIAYAGMGTLVDTSGIWSGQLRPGALMQVWRFKEDYEQVVQGVDVKKLDPYGHSFIFMSYVHDEDNTIIGIKIADQGFQSYRLLIPRDYEVWWAVNLSI
jgi:hypothetical protein